LQAVSASVKAVGPDMKRRAAFRPGRPCGLLLGLILPGLVGCSAARLHLLTLEYRQIEPEGPLVHEKSAREGYFWIDETDQVRIGLRDHVANWLDSDAGRTLEVSLVLDGIPADRARNYPATRRTLRGRASDKNEHVRFASIRGITAVWRDGPDRIRGRFRISTRYQKFSILLGWHGTQQVLVLGEFVAVRDRERTEAIVARTEADGMSRSLTEPQPTQPVPITGPAPGS